MEDGHAYASIVDCVSDFLAHGHITECMDTALADGESGVVRLADSALVQQLYKKALSLHGDAEEELVFIGLNEWSDDFDANNTKDNRFSVWVKSVTLLAPHGATGSLNHTYPVAIGVKGQCHDGVEKVCASALKTFQTAPLPLLYHGGKKKMVRVSVHLIASLQDQPERRGANYILRGNSRYTARWGHVMDLASLASKLVACNDCLKELVEGTDPSKLCRANPCTKCACWNTALESDLLSLPPPAGYPQSEIPETGRLLPKPMSFEMLKGAVAKAYDKIVDSTWTRENAEVYLASNGLNDDCVQGVLERAFNVRNFAIADGEKEDEPLPYDALRRLKEEKPALFRPWEIPALWDRNVEIWQHVDTIMHLLFLGVVKKTMRTISEWLKARSKFEAFIKVERDILKFIQSLRLSFFKALPFATEKMGGYVSENYLGICRVLKWFYGVLEFAAADKAFVEPDMPQERWNKPDNVAWLKLRGLDHDGYAPEVRARVKQFMEQDGGPPPVLSPKGGGALPLVLDVVASLHAMVASIMVEKVTKDTIRRASCNIKVFLTLFERLDEGLRESGNDSAWVSSYNFVCLLNLPMLMEKYGPLRNLWEGAFQGEGILRFVKPEIGMGVRVNWSANVMLNLLREKSLSTITSKLLGPRESADKTRTLYHRYRSKAKIFVDWHGGRPLSVIVLSGGQYGCAISGDEMCELKHSEYIGQDNGHSYHSWTLDNETIHPYAHADIVRYCLFLPSLGPRGFTGEETSYTAIDTQWNELDIGGRFVPPVATYHTIHTI